MLLPRIGLALRRRYYRRLAAVMLASAFGRERTNGEILELADRCLASRVRSLRDLRRVAAGRVGPVRVDGAGALELRRAGGGGLVLATLHAGPFFQCAVACARLGFSGRILMHRRFRDRFGPRFQGVARALGSELAIVAADERRDLGPALRGLRQGEVLMVVVDENFGATAAPPAARHHATLRFLGMPLRVRSSAATLAARAEVPLVGALASWQPDGHPRVAFSGVVEAGRAGDAAAAAAAMRRLFGWFEPGVARRPEQWAGWFTPHALWAPPAAEPRTSPAELEAETRRLRSLMELPSGAQLRADPLRLAFLRRVQGRAHLLDGRGRRVLRLDEAGEAVVRSALRSLPLAEWPRRQRRIPGLAEAAARLVLAGLVEVVE